MFNVTTFNGATSMLEVLPFMVAKVYVPPRHLLVKITSTHSLPILTAIAIP